MEKRWTSRTGSLHFLPADGENHTFVTDHSADFRFNTLVMPTSHLRDVLESEEIGSRVEWHRMIAPDDPMLRESFVRVYDASVRTDPTIDTRADEAARRLVLRLVQISGGGSPDWHGDASVFSRRALVNLVAYIDEHLRMAPSVGGMALLVGMSPSHFARKFRQSTGLSLQRFVNRRRIRRSLDVLKDDSSTLTEVSLRLGFSSQSHFTRLFSGLTGMTPAKYRNQFKRTIG